MFWVALALAFAVGVGVVMGPHSGFLFLGGYGTEFALSIDNLAVIALLFRSLKTPLEMQPKVLLWGIIGAIVTRGAFVLAGSAALARFSWVTYVLGALVVLSGLRMAFRRHAAASEEPRLLRFLRRIRPLTPFLLAVLVIETTDVLFAVDSIPAIFGITRNPFLVYTSNLFAVMGLRSLYVLIAPTIGRLRFLDYALSLLLIVIGLKMIL